MPITATYDHEHRRVVATAVGRITLDEIRSHLEEERQEPALDQVLLVGRQHEAGTVLQQLAEIIVIEWRHDMPPNCRTIFGPI